MKHNTKWITIGVVIILVLFAASIIVMWQMGIFKYITQDTAGAEVVAAVIALVGVLFTGVVSVIGMLIKHSIDLRNIELKEQEEKRLNQEAEHNAELSKQAEARLKQEAAIKAIQSLSSGGQEAHLTQRAGVVFALANLGLIELAITLLSQMVNNKTIDATTTDIIIDRALRSDNQIAQDEAIHLLSEVACNLLLLDGKARFPSCLLDYDLNLEINIRREGIVYLIKQMLSKSYPQWDKDFINDRRSTLITIWKTEDDENIKSFAAHCLIHMCKFWEEELDRKLYWSYEADKWIMCPDLLAEINKLCPHAHCDENYREILDNLRYWVEKSLTTTNNK